MGEIGNAYTFFDGKYEGKRSFGRMGLNGRMKLKWILKK
jgi:hypothetical protein